MSHRYSNQFVLNTFIKSWSFVWCGDTRSLITLRFWNSCSYRENTGKCKMVTVDHSANTLWRHKSNQPQLITSLCGTSSGYTIHKSSPRHTEQVQFKFIMSIAAKIPAWLCITIWISLGYAMVFLPILTIFYQQCQTDIVFSIRSFSTSCYCRLGALLIRFFSPHGIVHWEQYWHKFLPRQWVGCLVWPKIKCPWKISYAKSYQCLCFSLMVWWPEMQLIHTCQFLTFKWLNPSHQFHYYCLLLHSAERNLRWFSWLLC